MLFDAVYVVVVVVVVVADDGIADIGIDCDVVAVVGENNGAALP